MFILNLQGCKKKNQVYRITPIPSVIINTLQFTPKKYNSFPDTLFKLLLANAIFIFLLFILEKLHVPDGSISNGFNANE